MTIENGSQADYKHKKRGQKTIGKDVGDKKMSIILLWVSIFHRVFCHFQICHMTGGRSSGSIMLVLALMSYPRHISIPIPNPRSAILPFGTPIPIPSPILIPSAIESPRVALGILTNVIWKSSFCANCENE